MPYINKSDRAQATTTPYTPGELNFAITSILLGYLLRCGDSYTFFNDCLGALEGAKLELYRRKIAPYEERKRKKNGDVYSL